MADFTPAFEAMIRNEGGYILHDVPGDRGGMTYAGIARNMHPAWSGWIYIDRKETPPTDLVRMFYKQHFWDRIKGDDIASDKIASTLFDFHVNAGGAAIKLAQLVVGATPDGVIGQRTMAMLNAHDPDKFIMSYTVAKIARYRDIVMKNRAQGKFLLGWLNRALKGVV